MTKTKLSRVEFYLEPELEELVTESEKKEEWLQKINDLGLEGQIKLTVKSEKKSASPYMHMNQQMKKVYKTLCPEYCNVKDYKASAIPLDVLGHVALCQKEEYFEEIQVWWDDKSPDPVVVGIIKDGYDRIFHLIARWGDEIIPYEILAKKAVEIYRRNYELALNQIKEDCEALLRRSQTNVGLFFNGKKGSWDMRPRVDIDDPS